MSKNIITTPASKVKAVTLYVVDYAEVGVDKAIAVSHTGLEKTVDGVQTTACATMIAGGVVKTAWKNHRDAKADRLVERGLRREAKAFEKHMAEEAKTISE